jgi:hypothetical protein
MFVGVGGASLLLSRLVDLTRLEDAQGEMLALLLCAIAGAGALIACWTLSKRMTRTVREP